MEFNEVAKLWAAIRLAVDVEDIASVTFWNTGFMGGYCETCEHAEARVDVHVHFRNGRFASIEIEDTAFTTLLEELVTIGQESG